MNAWLLIGAASVATYLLRASALVAVPGRGWPAWIERRLVFVAPAAMGALVAFSALHNDRGLAVGAGSVAAFAAVRHWQRPALALAVGFPVMWTVQLLVG